MSDIILSIAAQADKTLPEHVDEQLLKALSQPSVDDLSDHSFPRKGSKRRDGFQELRAGSIAERRAEAEHGVQGSVQVEESAELERYDRLEEERTRRTYRRRTVKMLGRYMRYSIEIGRLPSIVGREFFGAEITPYTSVTFEDRVIFVHDMETCLNRLDEFSRDIILRHVLQEHDQAETARLLNCAERTVRTYIPIALDLLSQILLDFKLLERIA